MELALFYSPDASGSVDRKIQTALAELGIPLRRVLGGELGQPVGALAGLDAPEANVAAMEPFPQSAMVFCGLTEQRLREALKRLNEKGVGGGCLKAVLTPRNLNWRFYDLLKELSREREAFLQMQRGLTRPESDQKQ